jgi:signal peptidase I
MYSRYPLTFGGRMKQWLRHNRSLLAFMFLLVFFRSAIANWYPIPSSSMHPNILEGDVVFVNRLAFDAKIPFTDKTIFHIDNPQRGDIVVFMSPVTTPAATWFKTLVMKDPLNKK